MITERVDVGSASAGRQAAAITEWVRATRTTGLLTTFVTVEKAPSELQRRLGDTVEQRFAPCFEDRWHAAYPLLTKLFDAATEGPNARTRPSQQAQRFALESALHSGYVSQNVQAQLCKLIQRRLEQSAPPSVMRVLGVSLREGRGQGGAVPGPARPPAIGLACTPNISRALPPGVLANAGSRSRSAVCRLLSRA